MNRRSTLQGNGFHHLYQRYGSVSELSVKWMTGYWFRAFVPLFTCISYSILCCIKVIVSLWKTTWLLIEKNLHKNSLFCDKFCCVYDNLGFESLDIMKCVTIRKMNLKHTVWTGTLQMYTGALNKPVNGYWPRMRMVISQIATMFWMNWITFSAVEYTWGQQHLACWNTFIWAMCTWV